MYRCTVSHESEPLAQLVRCFERRGIFDCDAQIPEADGARGDPMVVAVLGCKLPNKRGWLAFGMPTLRSCFSKIAGHCFLVNVAEL